ncbi:MAG: TetR/AcrR family transcriptional regulator [Desulfobacteraceae bacterium]
MNAQKRDADVTKKALLDAAEELFLEKGYGDTATSEISKKAGITKSMIHHYFGSKSGLWQAVKLRRFEEYFDKQMTMFEEYDTSEKVELLRQSFHSYFRFLQKNPQLVRILAWMFLERDQEICIEKDKKLLKIGVEQLEEAQRMGNVRGDIDPRFVIFTFIGLSQYWFQQKEHFVNDFGTEGLPEDMDEAFLESVSKIFFEGVIPR